jgi:glycosyltransferase involved in cell wall biosynthesis
MESFWAEIANFADAKKKTCFIIYPKINKIPEKIRDAPLELVELDFNNRSLKTLRQLRKLIKNNNIDFIYLTDRPSIDPYYFLLRLFGIKIIMNHVHRAGGVSRARMLFGPIKSLIHKTRLFSCDYFICVSSYVRNCLEANAFIPKTKCKTVLNGINPIEADPRCHHYANDLFSIPQDSFIIVTTGRATYYKGIDFVIHCANELINRHNRSNVYFLYCGSGPNLDNFKILAQNYDLTHRFIFAGQRTDISCILQSCNIAIHASKCEAFSLSILEYLSAGLATLAPRICGNIEAIQDETTGFLYSPGNSEEVVTKLLRILDDDQLRTRLGDNARKSVTDVFNINRTTKELLNAVESIVS